MMNEIMNIAYSNYVKNLADSHNSEALSKIMNALDRGRDLGIISGRDYRHILEVVSELKSSPLTYFALLDYFPADRTDIRFEEMDVYRLEVQNAAFIADMLYFGNDFLVEKFFKHVSDNLISSLNCPVANKARCFTTVFDDKWTIRIEGSLKEFLDELTDGIRALITTITKDN